MAGTGLEIGKRDAVLFVRLLHAGGAQVVEDDRGEVVAAGRLADGVDEFVVLVDGEGTVGRDALDGEGAGDSHLVLVLVGLVVEVFVVGLGRDGGVNLLLAGDALLPPGFVQVFDGLGPALFGLARDLPLLPAGAQGRVQALLQRLQPQLEIFPDDVDLGVVGDGAQGDVGDALVDEALADVAVAGRYGRRLAFDLSLLLLSLAAVGEQVVGVAGAHDAGAGQGEGDARGVDGDPTAAPLFGDVGGGAGAAGGVEDEVARVGSH